MFKTVIVVAALLSPATVALAQSLPAQAVPYQSAPNFNTDSSTSSQADITNPGGFGSANSPAELDRHTTGSISNETKCRQVDAAHRSVDRAEKKCR